MSEPIQSLSDDEISEILSLRLVSPLPVETAQRLLMTVAEVPGLRELAERTVTALNAVNLLAQDRELWVLHGPRMAQKIRLAAERGLLGR